MASEGTNQQPSKNIPKAKWNAVNRKLYIDLAYKEMQKGNRNGMGFTKAGWENIRNEFNTRTKNSYNMKKFKNHHNRLKDEWKILGKMMNKTSGFGFDSVSKTITGADEVWDEFIKENPNATAFRAKPIEQWEELQVIFTGALDSGSTTQVDAEQHDGQENHNVGSPAIGNTLQLSPAVGNTSQLSPAVGNTSQLFPAVGNTSQLSPAVGKTSQLSRKRRSETPVFSRSSSEESREAAIESHLKFMSTYFEQKMSRLMEQKMSRQMEQMYNIPACIKRLNELPGMEVGNPMRYFALEMLESETKRKTFMSIVDNVDDCLTWIRRQMTQSGVST